MTDLPTGSIMKVKAPGGPSSTVLLPNVGRIVKAMPFTVGSSGVYEFQQLTPLISWTINHNLGFMPDVELFTIGNVKMMAEVVHTSLSQCIVLFVSPTAGSARLT